MWHVQSCPQTQNGVLGRARTSICRFAGKMGELRNNCLIQSVFSKNQAWLFRRIIKRFPCSDTIYLGYLDCVDYFPCYLGCNYTYCISLCIIRWGGTLGSKRGINNFIRDSHKMTCTWTSFTAAFSQSMPKGSFLEIGALPAIFQLSQGGKGDC